MPSDTTSLRIGIVGMGYVGRHLADEMNSMASIVTYDTGDGDDYPARELAACDIAFVCVDTPMGDDGSCDISNVERAVQRLPTERIVVRSTVPPGTTDHLAEKTQKALCHCPEFYGEGAHTGLPRPWTIGATGYLVLGGPPSPRDEIIDRLLPLFGPGPVWYPCSAVESEMIKYMENCYLAAKVAFVNEFHDLCARFGANWHTVREGWLLDPRIGRSHTAVFKDDRGFGGNCLPKDLAALIHAASVSGYDPVMLRAIGDANRRVRDE